jgi:hypothetical protein
MRKIVLLVATLAASAALAQPQPAQRSAPGAGPNAGLDMQETICRSRTVVDSRLTRNRVCATRQQWLEQQRMDRLYTEKAQTNRIWPQ